MKVTSTATPASRKAWSLFMLDCISAASSDPLVGKVGQADIVDRLGDRGFVAVAEQADQRERRMGAPETAVADILVEGEETLLIMSGVKGGEKLRRFANIPENIVFMKAYRNMNDIISALDQNELLANSVAVKHCGLPQQEVIRDIGELKETPPNYWTLVLSKRTQFDEPTQI